MTAVRFVPCPYCRAVGTVPAMDAAAVNPDPARQQRPAPRQACPYCRGTKRLMIAAPVAGESISASVQRRIKEIEASWSE